MLPEEFCRDTINIEGTDHDAVAKDIHTSEECRVPCPGACQSGPRGLHV